MHKHYSKENFLILASTRSGTRNRRPHRGWDLPARGNTGPADALGLFREHETHVQGTRLSTF